MTNQESDNGHGNGMQDQEGQKSASQWDTKSTYRKDTDSYPTALFQTTMYT